MNVSKFVGVTTWSSILLIIFGTLTKVFEANGWTIAFLAFLCIVGFLNYVLSVGRKNDTK